MAPSPIKRTISRRTGDSDSPSYFSCYECGARFPNLQALGGHKSVHSPKRRADKNCANPSPSVKRPRLGFFEAAVAPLVRSSPLPPTASVMCPPWGPFVSAFPPMTSSMPWTSLTSASGVPAVNPWAAFAAPALPFDSAQAMQLPQPPRNLSTGGPMAYPWPSILPFPQWAALGAPRHLAGIWPQADISKEQSSHASPAAHLAEPAESSQSAGPRGVPLEVQQDLGAHNSPAFAKVFLEAAATKLRLLGGRTASPPAECLARAASHLSNETSASSQSGLASLPAVEAASGYTLSMKSGSPSPSRPALTSAARPAHLPPLLPGSDFPGREYSPASGSQESNERGVPLCPLGLQEAKNEASSGPAGHKDFLSPDIHAKSACKPWSSRGAAPLPAQWRNQETLQIPFPTKEEEQNSTIDLSLRLSL